MKPPTSKSVNVNLAGENNLSPGFSLEHLAPYKVKQNRIKIFESDFNMNHLLDAIITEKTGARWRNIHVYAKKDGLDKAMQVIKMIEDKLDFVMRQPPNYDHQQKYKFIEMVLQKNKTLKAKAKVQNQAKENVSGSIDFSIEPFNKGERYIPKFGFSEYNNFYYDRVQAKCYKLNGNCLRIFSAAFNPDKVASFVQCKYKQEKESWKRLNIFTKPECLVKSLELAEFIYDKMGFGLKSIPEEDGGDSDDEQIRIVLEQGCHMTHPKLQYCLLGMNKTKYIELAQLSNKFLISREFLVGSFIQAFNKQREVVSKWETLEFKSDYDNMKLLVTLEQVFQLYFDLQTSIEEIHKQDEFIYILKVSLKITGEGEEPEIQEFIESNSLDGHSKAMTHGEISRTEKLESRQQWVQTAKIQILKETLPIERAHPNLFSKGIKTEEKAQRLVQACSEVRQVKPAPKKSWFSCQIF